MKYVDIKEMAKYADRFIALSADGEHILASGKTFQEVHEMMEKKKAEGAIIEYIPPLMRKGNEWSYFIN